MDKRTPASEMKREKGVRLPAEKRDLAIDLVAAFMFLIGANPALTGIGLHEWLGLGFFAVLFVHAVVHVGWVMDSVKAAFKKPTLVRTGNLVLDTLLLLVSMLCTISGLGISGAVLPAFGIFATGYYFWDPLHAFSAKLLAALLLIHVVVHGKWLRMIFKGKDRERF